MKRGVDLLSSARVPISGERVIRDVSSGDGVLCGNSRYDLADRALDNADLESIS